MAACSRTAGGRCMPVSSRPSRRYPDRLAEQVDRLAHHAFRGEVWEKAVAYSRQAGARAGSASAYQEAVASFEQALKALTHLPESRDTLEQAIDLRLSLARPSFHSGNWDGSITSARCRNPCRSSGRSASPGAGSPRPMCHAFLADRRL